MILSAHGFFAFAALALIVNAVVASLLLVYLPNRGLETLIWGTLIGLVAQLLLVGYETRRRRIKLAWRVPVNLRPTFLAGAGIIPGVLFAHLSILVPQIVAARLGDGAIATFSFAMRLHGAATQVLAVALSTVLLPSFAHAAGRGELSAISAQLKRSFPVVALISISMLLWVGLVGESLVSLAFERGAIRSIRFCFGGLRMVLVDRRPIANDMGCTSCKGLASSSLGLDDKFDRAVGASNDNLGMFAPFGGRWIAWTSACAGGRVVVYGYR